MLGGLELKGFALEGLGSGGCQNSNYSNQKLCLNMAKFSVIIV